MHLHTSRTVRFPVRLPVAFFLFICIISLLVFTRNQIRFQHFLSSHYISSDDFPLTYAALLRSKDWDSLETTKFDYARYFPSNATSDTTGTIPRTIHFIWFKDLYASRPSVTEIPSIGSEAPSLCRKHNPDYTVKVWNATAGRGLLEKHYAWFIPTYDSYKFPIQRIDALKYFVLWHYGGVYMDMDIACRRSLDPLLDYPAWFPEASPLGVNNDLMASRPRHPVVGLMLESLARRNRNLVFPYLTIFRSTGPQFTGDILKKWFLQHNRKPLSDHTGPDDWFVLPRELYSEEYTFFGHSPGGTWHGGDVATILWLVGHPLVSSMLIASILVSCLAAVLWRRRKSQERFNKSLYSDLEA